MALFELSEVLQLELDILNILDLTIDFSSNYFKEPVAQHLYTNWAANNNDTRLLIYCFPLIQSIMVKYLPCFNGLDQEDVFNSLCVILLEHFPKYKPENGRLYTYLTLITHYKLKDILTANTKHKDRHYELIEDWDSPVINIDAFAVLLDFKIFLTKLKEESGITLNKIIDALLLTLDDKVNIHLQDRKMLVQHLCNLTKLPDELIIHTLNRIHERYNHSVLD